MKADKVISDPNLDLKNRIIEKNQMNETNER